MLTVKKTDKKKEKEKNETKSNNRKSVALPYQGSQNMERKTRYSTGIKINLIMCLHKHSIYLNNYSVCRC